MKLLRHIALLLALVTGPALAAQTVIITSGQTAQTSSDQVCSGPSSYVLSASSPIPANITVGLYQVSNGVAVLVGGLSKQQPILNASNPGTFRAVRSDISAYGVSVQVTADCSGGTGGGVVTPTGQTNMAGALSVAIASDQSAVPENQTQVAGTAITVNNGVTTAGTQRVTLSSDSAGQVALAAGSAKVGVVTTDQTTHGTSDLVASDATKINGTAITVGNGTTSANTQRITIASDSTGQLAISQATPGTSNNVSLNHITASGTITTQNLNPNSGVATAGSTVAITLTGQNTVGVQVTGAWTAVGGLAPQVSVDGANWVTLTSQSLVAVTGVPTVTIASASVSTYQWNVAGWAQVRISAVGGAVTGTATVSLLASMSTASVALSQQSVGLAASVAVVAGSSLSNDVGVQYRATSTGGALVSKVLTTASTNLTTPKGTAGRLLSAVLTNTAASARFVHFYNNAAPTVGTTSPTFTWVIPAGQILIFELEGGIAFATAISYSITAAAGDLDATVTAANDVTGSIGYQ